MTAHAAGRVASVRGARILVFAKRRILGTTNRLLGRVTVGPVSNCVGSTCRIGSAFRVCSARRVRSAFCVGAARCIGSTSSIRAASRIRPAFRVGSTSGIRSASRVCSAFRIRSVAAILGRVVPGGCFVASAVIPRAVVVPRTVVSRPGVIDVAGVLTPSCRRRATSGKRQNTNSNQTIQCTKITGRRNEHRRLQKICTQIRTVIACPCKRLRMPTKRRHRRKCGRSGTYGQIHWSAEGFDCAEMAQPAPPAL